MLNVVKEPCTMLICGRTNCGKTKFILDLLEHEYKHHFEKIFIICSTIRVNKTYRERSWIKTDHHIFCIEPQDKLFHWITFLSHCYTEVESLFIIDDIIADKSLDKKRQSLIDLAISGRHRKHSLWLLTQSYTAIPKNLRRQKKMLIFWYPNEKSDLKIMDEETNVIDDLEQIKHKLRQSKYSCLFVRLEYPYEYCVLKNESLQ